MQKPTIKGTVSVILSDPSCKDSNVRLTPVTLKVLYDQVWIRYQMFIIQSCFYRLFSNVFSQQKWLAHFLTAGKHKGIIRLKHFLIEKKRHYLPRNWSDKGFKAVVY